MSHTVQAQIEEELTQLDRRRKSLQRKLKKAGAVGAAIPPPPPPERDACSVRCSAAGMSLTQASPRGGR